MAVADELSATGLVDAAVAKHLAHTYGVRARGVVERVKQTPALAARLDPETPYILAQVDVAVDEEQAETVEDLLGRRVPLLLRARDQGLAAAPGVAAYMAQKLGWTPAHTAAELARYQAIVARTRQFRD
jgi:glycerol-3-phosphate dehydrogenase